MVRAFLSFLVVLVGLASGSSLIAQQPNQPVRNRFSISGSVLRSEPGDERCDPSVGFGVGAEARTRGEWLVAAGVDVLASWAGTCQTYGIAREYKGQLVEIQASTDLPLAPRATLRVGRAFPIGQMLVEPAAAVGLFYLRVRFPSPPDAVWSKWYGGSLAFRVTSSRWGAFFEYGWRQVPFRYYVGSEIARQFGQREPLFRFGLGT
jgi:hypothetical protein